MATQRGQGTRRADTPSSTERGARTGPRLLHTKLTPPRLRIGTLDRKELVDRLIEGQEWAHVVVIEAPAGWGKSSLLAMWREASGASERFAWYSVEGNENDPGLFWSYVVGALEKVEPGVGDEAARLLRAPGTNAVEHVVPALVNALGDVERPVTIVFDDYHLVQNEEVHESVGFLVAHLPDVLRVVVSARSIPDLPLGRLRGQGRLLEIGIDDLRFDEREARELLESETGQALTDGVNSQLLHRTEGWAAGLHLAALSLRGRTEPEDLVSEFTGDHRLVVDYLASEVLDGQVPAVRSFLHRTAVADRVCASLADALTGKSDSAEMLEHVEREQLFLLPLDSRREWYRYHHLFLELLRRELERTTPDLVVELHLRAAAWFREHEEPADAIRHFLAAGEPDRAGAVLAAEYMDFLNQGLGETVLGWFEEIPIETMRRSNELCLARAIVLSIEGRVHEADGWLTEAEQAERTRRSSLAGQFPSFASAIAVMRSSLLYSLGDVGEAMRWSRRAHAIEPEFEGDVYLNSYFLGATAYRDGDVDDALRCFERDRAWSVRTNFSLLHLMSLGPMAVIQARRSERRTAEALLAEADALLARWPLQEHWHGGMLHLAAGLLARDDGDDQAASARLQRAHRLLSRSPDRLGRVEVLQELARTERDLGNASDAARHDADAADLLAICRDPGAVLRASNLAVLPGRRARGSRVGGLTDRQVSVLQLLAQGMSNAEIARYLGVSERTVHAHLRSLYERIGARSRTAAVRYAFDHDLV